MPTSLPRAQESEASGPDVLADAADPLRPETWLTWHGDLASTFEPYNDGAGRVVRLASRSTVSFRLGPNAGVSYARPVGTTYDEALEKFPSVRDCLIDTERQAEQPNLVAVDWTKFDSHYAALVYYIWIITSYQTVADFLAWMDAIGFTTGTNPQFDEIGANEQRLTRVLAGGRIDLNERRPLYNIKRDFVGWIRSWLEKPHYGFGARFTPTSGLDSANINAHSTK
ncbi:MAG: hypothetical protein AAGG06_19390 [Pseudomonadota bacterium]